MTGNDQTMTDSDLQTLDDKAMESLRAQITEHLQVKDINGEHVGTVDHLDGDRIKLTKSDSPDGEHHYVNLTDVRSADEVAVYLSKTRQELMS
ncbi:DUF2171 domain-containing protein [Deinococcus aquatilis]|jgi:hypothetical protein|uniref:DUF2171 domain-containing protein n=1 Tax=Deinococcus aquatilis TaxID=519440 RepID=UPI000360D838|nr:DUF2171 domain-containing protein [Deinococcus aquatilis]